MMKKLLSLSLSVILALTAMLSVSFQALADGSGNCGTNGDNVTWTLTGGTLAINKGTSGEARMTDFVNNGAARPGWYDSRGDITKIVIEEGVINIGAYAFDDCYNLTEVDFGTIDTLGNNAFMNCTSLLSINLPSSFNWMYGSVFEGCTALKSAYLGERWWTDGIVPDNFFKGCSALRVVRMGSKFTGFGTDTFSGCTALKVIISDNSNLSLDGVAVVPTSVLGGECSENTYSNKKLTYSYDMWNFALTFTGSGDMTDDTPWADMKSIIDTVSFAGTDAKTSVSTTAFNQCENLTSVDFTNIYAIGWGAFSDNPNLGSVQFDDELEAIWQYAFSNDAKIETIQFGNGSNDLHIYDNAFTNCTGTTYWLNLPANTKYVDEHAFWGTNFNYVHIYNANVVFGNDAFGNGSGGYARFFSLDGTHTSTYDYINNYKKKGYNWHYYCDSTHYFEQTVVAPTCTEQGYDRYGCIYCEQDEYKSNFVDALGHNYKLSDRENGNYIYECLRCGNTDYQLSAFEPMFYFKDALSTSDIDNAYHQPNYDGRVDVNSDGFINGRDWAIITSNIKNIDTTNKTTVIDINTRYQKIEGWGASGAWWAPEVGTWENTDDIVRLLYSKSGGIGLNIYRYNLGAGSLDDSSLYNVGTRTDCFLNADGTYNWDTDAGARNTLYWANKFCPNVKVEMFSNSAPVHMTKNGKAYGSPVAEGEDAQCNLDSSKYSAFADYVVKSAEHFIDEGYNVTEVSPINEPEWGWTGWYNGDGSVSSGQEGCHFEPSEARDFYNNAMVPALQNSSKLNGKVELAVWECAQLNHGWWWKNDYNGGFLANCFSTKRSKDWLGRSNSDDWQAWNSNIRSYTNTLDTHSYWASTGDRQSVMTQLNTDEYRPSIQKIKCSEYCQMYNDGSSGVVGHTQAAGGSTNGMGIDYGLAMADIIYQDMTILNAVEWDWWTACGKGVYTDSLVYVDANDHDNIQTAKRLWCLGNYSKFIQEGAQRIMVTTGSKFGANLYTKPENIYTWKDGDNTGIDKYNYIEESAYLNPDGSIAIVYVNNSDTIEYTTVNASGYNYFKTYVTDETKDLELYQSGSTSDAVCIPARSCTTVMLNKNTPKYLFAYFTGNSQEEQRIRFATSSGGTTFNALNNGGEVVTQTKGTLNCRDPYIFKGHDNYYYLIATDMDCNTGWWGNSTSMVIWRSKDLVNWTDETIIDMAQITNTWIGRCWAPQVIWDENEQKYMVYLSLYTDGDDKPTVIYYSYTDNLLNQSSYSYPHVLFAPNTGKDAIDADITEFGGRYYMFYKDEDAATICVTSADSLTGEYSTTDVLTLNTLFNDGKSEGLEGCQVYKEADGDYIFIADRYGANGVFAAFNLGSDLAGAINQIKNGKSIMDYYNQELTDSLSSLTPRHGSMISISNEEYDYLRFNL